MDFAEFMSAMQNITTSTIAPDAPFPQYAGYIGCLLAALFFGSNFIPVKKFETGDGMYNR